MHPKDIVIGETYLFIATLNPERKHLEGQAFTVVRKERVFRKVPYRRGKHNAGTRKVLRFFNDDGVGARADELGELPEQKDNREFPCKICDTGEMKCTGVHPNGQEQYECNECGETKSFP